MTVAERKFEQERYEIFTQTVLENLLVTSGHHRRDTWFYPATRTYTNADLLAKGTTISTYQQALTPNTL